MAQDRLPPRRHAARRRCARPLQRVPEIAVRVGIARIERQRPPIALDGPIMLVEQVQCCSQIVVGISMGRGELHRGLEAAGRLAELSCGVENQAERVMCLRRFRLNFQGFAEQPGGFVAAALLKPQIPQIVQCSEMPFVLREDRPIQLLGFAPSALKLQRCGGLEAAIKRRGAHLLYARCALAIRARIAVPGRAHWLTAAAHLQQLGSKHRRQARAARPAQHEKADHREVRQVE